MMLELRNICKTYVQGRLDVPVLRNINLSIDAGDYVAIMGPSGSGKTTLMNIIGCLDAPTEGSFMLDGENILGYSDNQLSDVRLHSIGFVFQSFYLLSRQSAIENVALPLLYAGIKKKKRMEIASAALERVGLGDRLHFKPTQLSGGQCQRVAIARAIVNNPKILLADEPTGALDTASGKQIMEIFQSLNDEGVTVIMITHEREIAEHARTIYRIRDGRFVDEEGNFLEDDAPAIYSSSAQQSFSVPETPIVSTLPDNSFDANQTAELEEGVSAEPDVSAENSSDSSSLETQPTAPLQSQNNQNFYHNDSNAVENSNFFTNSRTSSESVPLNSSIQEKDDAEKPLLSQRRVSSKPNKTLLEDSDVNPNTSDRVNSSDTVEQSNKMENTSSNITTHAKVQEPERQAPTYPEHPMHIDVDLFSGWRQPPARQAAQTGSFERPIQVDLSDGFNAVFHGAWIPNEGSV